MQPTLAIAANGQGSELEQMLTITRKLQAIVLCLGSFMLSGVTSADEIFHFTGHGGADGFGEKWTWNSDSGAYYVNAWAFSDTWDNPDPDIFQTAKLDHYSNSGWGVTNQNNGDSSSNQGQHGVDNRDTGNLNSEGDRDLILFEIRNSSGDLVAGTLSHLQIGYFNTDSDMDVLAFDDPAASNVLAPGSIEDSTLPALLDANSGWSRFTIMDVPVDTLTATGAGTTESSHWIVSTWLDGTNDAIKLEKLKFHFAPPPPGGGSGVPVPASVVLMLAGFALMRSFNWRRS